ncbi:MrcB family domain-containing protein [Mycoplasma sp. Mirounga ES2805-ORL]|uniref:MrcB family domain-containing protein n=1 Tax=Mycoplasma sp. Mirounga ES2805-ORL TaxID=754514 RepID=UPI00197C0492|nr:DUF3578 domain-containing protein [Mycoplasma sp. Mirounga ES2805-ORL]QSF13677.1 DUF3578 domain-containing protein [Mycoplasma sp. Mirounga ES2805-ORL]
MKMREVFIKIKDEYLNAKKQKFSNNKLAQFIRSIPEMKNEYSFDFISKKYKVDASPGKGGWVSSPWIGILDPSVTEGAQRGYYVVYFFTKDMKYLYLCLMQGFTYFKKNYKNHEERCLKVSKRWRTLLSSRSIKDTFFDLPNNEDNLDKKYISAYICGKKYLTSELPDEEVLKSDLSEMLGLYGELIGKIGNRSWESLTRNFASEEEDFEEDVVELEIRSQKSIKSVNNLKRVVAKTKEQKLDEYKRKIELGEQGEEWLIEYLKREGVYTGSEYKIEHTSKYEGDGTGYDIKILHKGIPYKYIEVKTTNEDLNTPFYMSKNEVEFSKNNSDKYCLYRIYNFINNNTNDKPKIISGNVLQKVEYKIHEDYMVTRIK